ncbi:MBL fold metallo-hydrolase [Salinibacillus xinjiangensis]|uniref:MBL fold metallo-hydrolase n=1 Tax=Salinibacillus xinjiangensis TaxID=1229268 RepID=A0A6G1X5G9_9BACI|nr:MBL fold metallo-hydrolase [Salinibacillus xinjiangensis]MRG86068.1 MBL fold metallo-hydrolase [Salinibacillus xinjiangensis]
MIHSYKKEEVTCVETTIDDSLLKGNKVFVYLVDGMLIDAGPQCLASELIPFYKKQSFDVVALTHSHEDHSGPAPWIQENHEVPIYVHENGIPICAKHCPYPKYRQVGWGIRDAFHAKKLESTIQSRKHEWEVIYTPGHADDHVSFLHRETGRLFTGDLFVSPKTKVIMDSESIPVIMSSIRKLLTYEFQSIFCSHSGYFANGRKMLKQKLDYLENLSGEVHELYNNGMTVKEIQQKLFPKKYPITTISEGEWDSLHVISSILNGERIEKG